MVIAPSSDLQDHTSTPYSIAFGPASATDLRPGSILRSDSFYPDTYNSNWVVTAVTSANIAADPAGGNTVSCLDFYGMVSVHTSQVHGLPYDIRGIPVKIQNANDASLNGVFMVESVDDANTFEIRIPTRPVPQMVNSDPLKQWTVAVAGRYVTVDTQVAHNFKVGQLVFSGGYWADNPFMALVIDCPVTAVAGTTFTFDYGWDPGVFGTTETGTTATLYNLGPTPDLTMEITSNYIVCVTGSVGGGGYCTHVGNLTALSGSQVSYRPNPPGGYRPNALDFGTGGVDTFWCYRPSSAGLTRCGQSAFGGLSTGDLIDTTYGRVLKRITLSTESPTGGTWEIRQTGGSNPIRRGTFPGAFTPVVVNTGWKAIDGSGIIITFSDPYNSAVDNIVVGGAGENRYWIGTANTKWSDENNWATTSGGTPPAPVPTASDSVFFDQNSSGNNCILDVPGLAGSLNCTGFGSGPSSNKTLNLWTQTLTLYGDLTLPNVTAALVCGSSTVALADQATIRGNGCELYHLQLQPGSGPLGNGTTVTINGVLSVYDLLINELSYNMILEGGQITLRSACLTRSDPGLNSPVHTIRTLLELGTTKASTFPEGVWDVEGSNAGKLVVDAVITSTATRGIRKTGTGLLVLNGLNGYTGNTVVEKGTVRAGSQVLPGGPGVTGAFGNCSSAIELKDGTIQVATGTDPGSLFTRPVTVPYPGGRMDAYGSESVAPYPDTNYPSGAPAYPCTNIGGNYYITFTTAAPHSLLANMPVTISGFSNDVTPVGDEYNGNYTVWAIPTVTPSSDHRPGKSVFRQSFTKCPVT
jgi:autotransporter-associated beta strand protein